MINFILASHKIHTKFDYKTGLLLTIHNQTRAPFSTITQNYGIHIPTGYETYIALTKKITKKLEYPFSNCIKDLVPFSEESKKIFGYFQDLNMKYYDKEFCNLVCFQDKLINKCGCCDIGAPTIRNASYCTSMEQLSNSEPCDNGKC